MIYDDIVMAYTGFSASKYSKLYGVALEDVLQDVLENYPMQTTKSRHEYLLCLSWESLDNKQTLTYNHQTF